jgi:hypothetical protein
MKIRKTAKALTEEDIKRTLPSQFRPDRLLSRTHLEEEKTNAISKKIPVFNQQKLKKAKRNPD